VCVRVCVLALVLVFVFVDLGELGRHLGSQSGPPYFT
jgi:hypothetical protein